MWEKLQDKIQLIEFVKDRKFPEKKNIRTDNFATLGNSLGGADFEIIPRTTFCLLTTCEQAHYISPHELVASSMTDKSAREIQR